MLQHDIIFTLASPSIEPGSPVSGLVVLFCLTRHIRILHGCELELELERTRSFYRTRT